MPLLNFLMHILHKISRIPHIHALALIVIHCMFAAGIVISSEGTFDPGDGILHYQISRFSWESPELFLHHWGKPFFTLVSSPFAQFGLAGTAFFNILCAAFSAWFAYLVSRHFKLSFSELAIPFLFFAPVYFPALNSGLTEPFFGLMVILPVYLLLKKKYALAAILLSFLPFIRSEGFLIIPFAGLYLAYHRKWVYLPLFGFATIAYSIAGYFFHYHDFFWISNKNPYSAKDNVYGSGSLEHFFIKYDEILGLSLSILFVSGVLSLTISSIRSRFKNRGLLEQSLLVFAPFLVYLFAHVLFWWKGIYGSLGLVRVIAAVMPLGVIICLTGFSFITNYMHKWIRIGLAAIFAFGVIASPFSQYYYPFKLDAESLVIKQAAGWLQENHNVEGISNIYYLHPFLTYSLGNNIFREGNFKEMWHLNAKNPEEVEASSLVVWDSHYGPNEGKVSLESLLFNPHYKLLKSFIPEQEIWTLGGHSYQVLIFEKLSSPEPYIAPEPITIEVQHPKEILEASASFTATSPDFKIPFNRDMEFGVDVEINTEVLAKNGFWHLNQSLRIYAPNGLHGVHLVISIEKGGKTILYRAKELKLPAASDWAQVDLEHLINPSFYEAGDKLKIYIWNEKRQEFIIDNFKVYWN
jgi:hypothetical protein